MARRSLKPQLNQIRTWVRQGRTDAWIAHQLEVSVRDISAFKNEHELEAGEVTDAETDLFGPRIDDDEPDLRAEDEALVAAALEAEQDDEPEPDEDSGGESGGEGSDVGDNGGDADGQKRRRRGRRGGRGRGRRKPLDGTFDHGEEGYGLWLDPAIQDNGVYAEHWAGHRPVKVEVEADRIVITRAGEGSDDAPSGDDEN